MMIDLGVVAHRESADLFHLGENQSFVAIVSRDIFYLNKKQGTGRVFLDLLTG